MVQLIKYIIPLRFEDCERHPKSAHSEGEKMNPSNVHIQNYMVKTNI